jgi:hypothetical protein
MAYLGSLSMTWVMAELETLVPRNASNAVWKQSFNRSSLIEQQVDMAFAENLTHAESRGFLSQIRCACWPLNRLAG